LKAALQRTVEPYGNDLSLTQPPHPSGDGEKRRFAQAVRLSSNASLTRPLWLERFLWWLRVWLVAMVCCCCCALTPFQLFHCRFKSRLLGALRPAALVFAPVLAWWPGRFLTVCGAHLVPVVNCRHCSMRCRSSWAAVGGSGLRCPGSLVALNGGFALLFLSLAARFVAPRAALIIPGLRVAGFFSQLRCGQALVSVRHVSKRSGCVRLLALLLVVCDVVRAASCQCPS